MSRRILIVEANRVVRQSFVRTLAAHGMRCAEHGSAEHALEALRAEPFDVVVADTALPGMGAVEMCRRVRSAYPEIPTVVLGSQASLDVALQAIHAGAYDYLPGSANDADLLHAVERAAQYGALQSKLRRLPAQLSAAADESPLIGASPAMAEVRDLLRRAATSDATVLFTGESGTGKELAARELHRLGHARGPFLALNCAAVPAPLLESELFGHRKGAFTDATSDRRGLFEEAGEGTLLLDEIADLPSPLQPKLLRVLSDRAFRPVGGTGEIPLRARVVAATNRDLDKAVAEGTFRQDLYYRVNVLCVVMPPLRARGHDVLLLAQHFIERCAQRTGKPVRGLSSDVAARLLTYRFPGNVRELRNCIESAFAITRHDHIALGDLPARVLEHRGEAAAFDTDGAGGSLSHERMPTLAEVEQRHIRRVLVAVGGNKAAAARVLGLDRKTLYRRMARLHIELRRS